MNPYAAWALWFDMLVALTLGARFGRPALPKFSEGWDL